jgi:predicted O-methyltransferase YrrM
MSDTFTIDTVAQAFGQPNPQFVQQVQDFKPAGYHFVQFMQQMKNPVVLEIGCDIGDTSQFLLDCNEGLKLYTIDPYDDYVDWNGNNLNERQKLYEHVRERFAPYDDRFKLYRLTSDDAVDEFQKEFFDFIFIDGLHTYDQLSKDCANYYSKLKPGGIFAGHDYTVIEGVNRAVNEFAAKHEKQIHQGDCDTWFWIK